MVTSTVALHLTLNISETVRDRGLVPKDYQLHELETSNLVCSFVSGMPSGCTKNFPESWRGLGHVTPYNFWHTIEHIFKTT